MTTALQTVPQEVTRIDPEAVQKLLLSGDLSGLTATQKVQYYNRVCETVGLNHLTKPLEYMKLNGKEVLYATKGCAEQLRMIHKISLKILSREKIDDVYVVTAAASFPDGRVDSSTGAVALTGLKGDSLANAMMKAETKAKRRVTLSICGLNMLDELEVETIADRGGVYPEQPGPDDGDQTPSTWKFSFGKWKSRTVEEVYLDPAHGPERLKSYIQFLEDSSQKQGKPLSTGAQEAIQQIEDFLGVMENRPLEPGTEG